MPGAGTQAAALGQGRTQGVLCIQKIPKRNDRKNKNTVGDSIVRGGNLYFMTCALVINILVHIRDALSLGPHCGVYKGHVILRFLSSANTSMISSRSIGMSRKIDMIHMVQGA